MERKVINGEEDLEYVCPECGATFSEGDATCPTCGIEFDWSEELEYLCPECGSVVDPEGASCPGCNAEFSTDENGEMVIQYEPDVEPPSVEELLDTAIDEVMVHPNGEPEDEEARDEDATGDDLDFEDLEGKGGEVGEEPSDAEPAEPVEASPTATPAKAVGGETDLYPGGFSRLGLVFLFLALLSLIFAVLMARYDTWIQGAAEESMGSNQRMGFLAGLGGFAVFILMAVVDLIRSPRKAV